MTRGLPEPPGRAGPPDAPLSPGTAAARVPEDRAARWIAVILIVVALVVFGWLAARKQIRDGNDFPIYLQAARDLLAGRSPYDVTSGLHGYVYLPWFALLLSPLAALPLPAAIGCWYVANLLFGWFAGAALLAAFRKTGLTPAPRTLALASLPLAGLAHDNLVLGQANLFLLWLCALGVRAAVEMGSSVSNRVRGAALGLAAALKMSSALLVPPLALRRRWRSLVAFAASAALAVALPFLVTGPAAGSRLLAAWHAKVVAPAAAGTLQGSKIIDQSPHAGLRRLLVAEPAFGETRVNVADLSPRAFTLVSRAVAVTLLAAYLMVWLTAPARGTPLALLLDLALGCCAMVQVPGYNLKAQFVVLLLPAWTSAALAWGGAAPRAARGLLLAAGVLFLLSYSDLVGRAISNLSLAYSSMAVGTLLLATALTLQRFATPSPSAGRSDVPGTGTAR